MNRYAPELALVAGGLLGGVFGGFVLVVMGEFYSAAIVAAVCGYPFAAYAIRTDDEPTTVLPPWLVIMACGLAAIGVLLDVLRVFGPTVDSLLFGWLVGIVVFVPAAAYGTRYGSHPPWLPPRWIERSCMLLAVGLLGAGLYADTALVGSLAGLLVFVAGVVFAARSTGQRRHRYFPVAGFLFAGCLLAVGVFTGGSLDSWVTAAVSVAFGPVIAFALS